MPFLHYNFFFLFTDLVWSWRAWSNSECLFCTCLPYCVNFCKQTSGTNWQEMLSFLDFSWSVFAEICGMGVDVDCWNNISHHKLRRLLLPVLYLINLFFTHLLNEVLQIISLFICEISSICLWLKKSEQSPFNKKKSFSF